MKTVNIRFSALTAANNQKFISYAGAMVNSLIQHSDIFVSPPVSPEALRADINILAQLDSLAGSADGSHNDRNARSLQRMAVYEKLAANGLYITLLANMKETYAERKALVELGSYPVAYGTYKPREIIPVTGLKVRVPTVPGERTVKARWRRGTCKTFIVEATQGNPGSPDTKWNQMLLSSKAKCILTLEPGRWAIRVIAMYRSTKSEPSTPVSFMIS